MIQAATLAWVFSMAVVVGAVVTAAVLSVLTRRRGSGVVATLEAVPAVVTSIDWAVLAVFASTDGVVPASVAGTVRVAAGVVVAIVQAVVTVVAAIAPASRGCRRDRRLGDS